MKVKLPVIIGDLLDLDSMHRAMAGCDTMYFGMSVSDDYLAATVNAAAVGKHHGVTAFVNMSQMTLAQMNLLFTADSVRECDQIRLPLGEGKTSPVAVEDIARVLVTLLVNPQPNIGKIYHLTGPQSENLHFYAQECPKALGRTITYQDMGHVNSVLMALSKCSNPTIFQKTLSINDYYFGSPEWRYPMGHISFVGKLDGETLKAGAPAIAPGWTLDLMARHSLDFWLTSEDLPDPSNRVTLDSKGGIVLSYRPNNEEGHKRLIAKLKDLMKQQTKCKVHGHECHEGLFARSLYIGQRIPLAGVAHQVGTVRFGNDPKTSALDRNCKAHDVDNLYVVDGSIFCSSGAANLALTIMANALRVGDHVLERLR